MPSKSPNAKSTKRNAPSHDEIRLRAYEISQSSPSGDDLANWLEAERQLVEAAAPKPRRRKTVAA
jgi:Protein of unknown function (DUF2934)